MTPEEEKLQRFGIPRRFWSYSVDTYQPPVEDKLAFENVVGYCDHLQEHVKTGRGILLIGDPGRGKTMFACMVAMEAIAEEFSAAYTSLAGYLRNQQRLFNLNALIQAGDTDVIAEWHDRDDWMMEIRNRTQFLVVDDVGKEHLTQSKFAEDEFDYLVRHRFDRALPTILTSNQGIEEWGERYSVSMKSFMHESSIILRVGGDDARVA